MRKIVFWKYVIVASIVSLINILFYDNLPISYLVVGIEISLLFFELLRKNYCGFLCYYVIFISFCLEFPGFTQNERLYNLKDIRILGINLGIWVGIPTIIIFLINFKSIWGTLRKSARGLRRFATGFFGMNTLAILVGAVLIIVNDNGIQNLEGMWGMYIGEMYQYIFVPVLCFCCLALSISFNESKIDDLVCMLQAVLWAAVIQQVMAVCFSIEASYGGTSIALTSMVCSFTTFLLLFFAYDNILYPKVSIIMGIVSMALAFVSGMGGKGIVVIVVLVLVFEVMLVASNEKGKLVLGILLPVVAITVFGWTMKSVFQENDLMAYKLYSLKSMFGFGPGWLENMAHSPKVRVGEIINIAIEYIRKPWLLITGKGFLGTVKDYSNVWENAIVSYDAFTDEEWNANVFYSMHEITSYLLIYGGIGIMYMFSYLKFVVQHYKKSVWVLLGVYWFVLFYGFSFTIASYGSFVFFYSIYEAERNDKKDLEYDYCGN